MYERSHPMMFSRRRRSACATASGFPTAESCATHCTLVPTLYPPSYPPDPPNSTPHLTHMPPTIIHQSSGDGTGAHGALLRRRHGAGAPQARHAPAHPPRNATPHAREHTPQRRSARRCFILASLCVPFQQALFPHSCAAPSLRPSHSSLSPPTYPRTQRTPQRLRVRVAG